MSMTLLHVGMIWKLQMSQVFHYPPELIQLLIDTIPLLCRSKTDVLLFFKGAGVSGVATSDLAERVREDKQRISKYEIVRTVLSRLNERGDQTLRERREVLKRVTEFEDFSTCWPDDQLKAKGLVSEIRRTVDVKDAFTRMKQERDGERRERIEKREAELAAIQKQRDAVDAVKSDLYALFGESDHRKRGIALEGILNRLFQAFGILIQESFTLTGDEGEGIVEQIDGVIELDGHLYFVEMKWWDKPVGVTEIAHHMMRVFLRTEARALIVSASDFTAPAVSQSKEALSQKVVTLCTLEEIVKLLDRHLDLRQFVKAKAHAWR